MESFLKKIKEQNNQKEIKHFKKASTISINFSLKFGNKNNV